MITLAIILTLILAAILVVCVLTLSAGGAFILIFGDLIVCIAIVAFIVKLYRNRKKKK